LRAAAAIVSVWPTSTSVISWLLYFGREKFWKRIFCTFIRVNRHDFYYVYIYAQWMLFFYVDSICLDRWIGDDGFFFAFINTKNICVLVISYQEKIITVQLERNDEMGNISKYTTICNYRTKPFSLVICWISHRDFFGISCRSLTHSLTHSLMNHFLNSWRYLVPWLLLRRKE
jgi:hypothetical protein